MPVGISRVTTHHLGVVVAPGAQVDISGVGTTGNDEVPWPALKLQDLLLRSPMDSMDLFA